MTCKDCGSERLANVGGKCSDLGNLYVPHLDIDIDGYHPNIKGICSSDYIDLGFCLECGKIQTADFPLTDETLKEICCEEDDWDE